MACGQLTPGFLADCAAHYAGHTCRTDLQKVAIPRSLIAATRTLLVPHSGKLGFIFWPMPFLKLKNCGFGNYFRKTQSKLASFGIFNTFVQCFGFCCQIMSRITLFSSQILCRESRCFGATFQPLEKWLVPQTKFYEVWSACGVVAGTM